MGYYTIMLSPSIQDITKTVTEFGKFRYNRLPMGMCTLGYIFQDKLDELLGDIEGIKTYIDDILVFSIIGNRSVNSGTTESIWYPRIYNP